MVHQKLSWTDGLGTVREGEGRCLVIDLDYSAYLIILLQKKKKNDHTMYFHPLSCDSSKTQHKLFQSWERKILSVYVSEIVISWLEKREPLHWFLHRLALPNIVTHTSLTSQTHILRGLSGVSERHLILRNNLEQWPHVLCDCCSLLQAHVFRRLFS